MRARSTIFVCALLASAGCETLNGEGFVEASFYVDDCPPGTKSSVDSMRFEAGWLATERYAGVLIVNVQQYRVRVEETDGAAIRIALDDLVDAGSLIASDTDVHLADETRPLVLPLVPEGGFANGTLSLFQTCPNFPTLHAISGSVEIAELVLAQDPEDTGDGEKIAGTFTATVARSDDLATPAGFVTGSFDFEPPARPTVRFK